MRQPVSDNDNVVCRKYGVLVGIARSVLNLCAINQFLTLNKIVIYNQDTCDPVGAVYSKFAFILSLFPLYRLR